MEVMAGEIFLESAKSENENNLIQAIRPELNNVCANPIRACILHLLLKARNLDYSLGVEEIARSIGKRHSVIIHHLEKLKNCNLVQVIKSKKYGNKEKRSIWGLNTQYPNLISLTYDHTLKFFFTQATLEKMCNVNSNPRNAKAFK